MNPNMRTLEKSSRTSSNGRRTSAAAVRTHTAEHVRRPEQRTIHFLTQDELRQLSDFSVVLFRPNFMLASEENLMKAHKNQWLLTLPSPPDSLVEP